MKRNLWMPAICLPALLLASSVQAEQKVDETRQIAPDARVEIHNMRGDIRVRGGSNELRIVGTIGEGAKGLIVEGDPQRWSVRVDYPEQSGWGGWWGRSEVRDSSLQVDLPTGVTLVVESVSADIDVAGVGGARVEIESVSGDIELDSTASEVEVTAVSGDLILKTAGARKVELETVSGDIDLSGQGEGSLRVETVSGRAKINANAAGMEKIVGSTVSGDLLVDAKMVSGGRIQLEAMSGDIELTLPPGASGDLRIETFSGDISSPVGKVEREEYGPGAKLRHALGDGRGEIRLESFSGDVRLRTQ
ncbi:DUF4097 family beta strand repeat-containing protein [Pseudomarimonas arenosa]|uniref:DUF4097 family beta strand repeat protein n=1 Tax=Pseudomarimonas arenosa TaxID=2774145 RepID=A0AAW3ZKY9_9GAMM|nr:DUF4097 family beta strand repeat-containing protein [Pseudomarimonas arenosa]MBD8524976.1 DUF4097 family beta strand repeat protein [Pseudomarimonas arenosa]